MKKYNAKKIIAQMLAVGVVVTTLFPGTAYAAEVGEQVSETTEQITTVLNENSDLIEQAVIEAIQERGGDINDQALVDQVREEVRKKIENGELESDEKTEEETTETTDDSSDATTEDTNTSSESVSVTDHTSADEILSDGNNSSKMVDTRLVVTSDVELTEYYGAVTVDRYDNIYVLAYKSAEETDSAFNYFAANGIVVEKDASMDAIKKDEVPEDKVAKEVTDKEVTDVVEDTFAEAKPVAGNVEEHKTIVAVIDTGISDVTNDDTFKDRIIEGTSTISDTYVDDNGHGTAMAKLIAEDVSDENVMILPIKALDKDGKGTVLSVALAIRYAKEHGADVINLSLSGVGTSNILTNAINDCYNNGITVVTAAGNNNDDAGLYMPGNVDTAINVAAAVSSADGTVTAASYTNHGRNIDFSAIGTYRLIVEKGENTLETELCGTSIASAHVSAYVALIKQINSTVDGVVRGVSENDVMESLKKSAVDCGSEGFDEVFGYGYLAKESLVFKESDKMDDEKDTDADENGDDRDVVLEMSSGVALTFFMWEGIPYYTISGSESTWHSVNDAGGAVAIINSWETSGCSLVNVFFYNDWFIDGQINAFVDTNISGYNPNSGSNSTLYFCSNGNMIYSTANLSVSNVIFDGTYSSSSGSSNYTMFIFKYGNNVTLDNCTMQNLGDGYANYKFDAIGVCVRYGANLNANNCKFNKISSYGLCIDCDKDPYWIFTNDDALPASGTVTNCTASDCTYGFSAVRNATFDHCTAYKCNYGINGVASQIWFSGTPQTGNQSTTITNCTAYDCNAGLVGAYNSTIRNSIAYSCTNGIVASGRQGDTCTVSNNKVYDCTNGIYTVAPDLILSGNEVHDNDNGIKVLGGTTTFENGTVFKNDIGIFNNGGTTTISGGAITKSTQMNVDIYDGTVNFNGGSITESGTLYFGVEIQNANTATFNQSASIGTNNEGGVRVRAQGVNRYNIYKGAKTAVGSNGNDTAVYLDPGASMTIHNALTSDVKVASYDRYTGKVIAYCDNEEIAKSAAQHLKLTGDTSFQKTTLNTRKYADTYADLLNAYGYDYEALWNHYNAYGRNEGRAAEDCGKTVVYRKGNGNTGANTQIIVSQTEDTSFDTNLEANKLTDSRFSARIRTSDAFTGHKNAKWRDHVTTYWGEYNSPRAESVVYLDGKDVSRSIYNSGWAASRNGQKAYGRILATYVGWYPATLYAKYETGFDPNANHNDIDKPETDDGREDILNPDPQAPEKKEDTKPDTPTPEGLSFYFNGNGQDEGVNYTVRHISTTYPMPDVTDFMKNDFSGQGFSVLKDANYKNTQEPTKVRKAGETVNTIILLNSLLGRNDCEVAVSDGNITVTQYVTWDAVPTITMADKYWYYSEVRDMTDEEIIEKVKKTTHVMDKEDTNGRDERGNATSLKVEIEGLDRNCFDKLGEIGYTSVRGYVTDAVGNKAFTICRIHIVNAKSKNKTLDPTAGPLEASYYTYSRFIDKENYYKTKKVNGKVVPDSESGALQENSIWYENEEYRKLIEDTLALEGTDQSVVSYEFDIHDLAASKYYCKVHFIGKFWGEDNLDNWYRQFITDAGARVSGTLPDNRKAE